MEYPTMRRARRWATSAVLASATASAGRREGVPSLDALWHAGGPQWRWRIVRSRLALPRTGHQDAATTNAAGRQTPWTHVACTFGPHLVDTTWPQWHEYP